MNPKRPRHIFLVLMLGSLATLSPVAIDLYLPAFQEMADALGTTSTRVALSLSSYFVGISLGQLFYGPLLDRFGRRRPLFLGLGFFVLASLGCLQSESMEALIAFRLLQGLGGCVASVASMAMVRDFFPPKDSARIFSLLMLILSVSPLFAPTFGGMLVTFFGWQSVFVVLALFALGILSVLYVFLPEGHQPDRTVTLKPAPIFRAYLSILRNAQFSTYALSGALSFAGLFAYVAGSPIIFMDNFGISAQVYGAIFAGLATGIIGSAQVNILLMKKYRSEQIFRAALVFQTLVGSVFLAGTMLGGVGLVGTIVLLFLFLSCLGLSNPNASALALAPFSRNVGSASALLGFLNLGAGAVASAGIGMLGSRSSLPIITVLAGSALAGLIFLLLGRHRIRRQVEAGPIDGMIVPH